MSEIPPREWLNLRDAWHRLPERQEYVLPRMIGVGETCLVAGPADSGKTMFLLTIAICVASGKPLCEDFEPPSPTKVLYVDEEVGQVELMRRLRGLANGLEVSPDQLAPNLEVACQQGYSLSTEERSRELLQKVKACDARLLIMDTFVGLYGRDENDNTEVRRWFDQVVSPIRTSGCAVVISHHLNKERADDNRPALARIRGATDFRSYPDKIWMLHRAKARRSAAARNGGLRIVVSTEKARRHDSIPALLVDYPDSTADARIAFGARLPEKGVGIETIKCRSAIVDELARHPDGIARLELISAISRKHGLVRKTIERTIAKLATDMEIAVRGEKQNRIVVANIAQNPDRSSGR